MIKTHAWLWVKRQLVLAMFAMALAALAAWAVAVAVTGWGGWLVWIIAAALFGTAVMSGMWAADLRDWVPALHRWRMRRTDRSVQRGKRRVHDA